MSCFWRAIVLTGKTVVFTGSLETMTRSEAQARAEGLGAKVAGAVSKKQTMLSPDRVPVQKEKRAVELGITVLSEAEWMDLISV